MLSCIGGGRYQRESPPTQGRRTSRSIKRGGITKVGYILGDYREEREERKIQYIRKHERDDGRSGRERQRPKRRPTWEQRWSLSDQK